MTVSPQHDPARAGHANAMGMAALRAGDAAAAVAAFRDAVAADATAPALWRNLAHAHRLAGDDAEELAALNAALDLDRVDFVANLRKAQNLQRADQRHAAHVAWAGVLQLAAGLDRISVELDAELALGRGFVATVGKEIAAVVDQAIAPLADDLDETERRRVNAFADLALGRRRVFHNECAGLHYPFLPEDEFFDSRHFPWFADLEGAAPAIRREYAALFASDNPALRPYVRMDAGTPHNKWTALDNSLDWTACFLWEYGAPNDPVLEACPETARVLSSLPRMEIPGKAPNAFFSLLRPHSEIPPHTGVTNTRAIIHLALEVPKGCGFRVGNETREWVEGTAFAFDDTIEHSAWNRSDQRRAVLIFDCWNPHLSPRECEAVARYFTATGQTLDGL